MIKESKDMEETKMNYRGRVHPDLLEMYDSEPELELDLPDSLRTSMEDEFKTKGLPAGEEVEVSERYIAGAEGGNIYIRIYRPANNNDIRPGLLWIHGGGYIAGFVKIDEGLCIRFVTEAKCVVVSVEYRLAPEYPYPIPLEDCYSALKWLYDNAEEINADKNRIAVAGNSAGGGLTAALSLLARDRGGPKIVFQAPLYPMLDDSCGTPSCVEMQDRKAWFGECNELAWSMYLSDYNTEDVPQYAAPARARDLTGLPAAYTFIGDLDPLRDETIEYTARLSRAGVPVEFHLYPGCFHAFDVSAIRTEIGDRALSDFIAALARALR